MKTSSDILLKGLLEGLGLTPSDLVNVLTKFNYDQIKELGEFLTKYNDVHCDIDDDDNSIWATGNHTLNEEAYSPDDYKGLTRYPDDDKEISFPTIVKIVVKDEYAKDQLLLASNYIHNLKTIDSDYMMVNTIMHLYERPQLIEVEQFK